MNAVIVDAHTHILPNVAGLVGCGPTRGAGFGRVLAGGQMIQVMPPLCETTRHTPEMLIAHMKWAGIDRAVLLQGPFYGECNGYVSRAVRRYADRFVGCAHFDPWLPASRAASRRLMRSGTFVGIKMELSEGTGLCGIHPHARLDEKGLGWLWKQLEELGLVLVLDLGAIGSVSYQTNAVRSLASAHPGLSVVIAHLAQPSRSMQADKNQRTLWEEQLDLGLLPNVHFDTSSLPAYFAHEGFPFPSAGEYLRVAVQHIGPSKLMWGSDIPALLMHGTYPQLLETARLHLDDLPSGEREMIFATNARRVYRISHDVAAE